MSRKFFGYTIIELVLILVIIGILSAYALPRFFNSTAFNERFYYDSVKSLLHSAQKISIASGCHAQVVVTANSVSSVQRAACTEGNFPTEMESMMASLTVSNDVALITSDFPMYFDALGQAINSTSGLVADGSITINSKTINIIGATGLIYDAE